MAAKRRVAIVHILPLEYYPPATNTIDHFSESKDLDTLVLTTENEKQRLPYANEHADVRRLKTAGNSDGFIRRWWGKLCWHWNAAGALSRWKPDVVFYYEPHSAICVALYFLIFRGRATLFIHHHEYYSRRDLRQRGNRLTWINDLFERVFLLRRAIWVSHTNADRIRLFAKDHPKLDTRKLRVLPNYPPETWYTAPASQWPTGSVAPLKLVYVGSISMRDTYVEPLIDWLRSLDAGRITLDIYAYNMDSETREFLRRASADDSSGSVISFHEGGIEYAALPSVLSQYHVGLILYRCNTTNFVFNTSNKLFEYQALGLDVWFPKQMTGVQAHRRIDRYPRVVEVDFDNLQSLNLNNLASRNDLIQATDRNTCQAALHELDHSIRFLTVENEVGIAQ